MKYIKLAAAALCSVLLWACGSSESAKISGTLEGVSEGNIVVKALNLNKLTVVDTIAVKNGSYSCSVPVKAGDPEFFYVYYGDTKVASLILQKGENAKVSSDTLGHYSVSGSPESEKMQEAEVAQSEFSSSVAKAQARIAKLDPSSEEALAISLEMYRDYVAYYRKQVRFVLQNPKSLSLIPVLYEKVGDFQIFSNSTDAIHFRNVCDSLTTVYPESRYVKALEAEAARRENALQLNTYIQNAGEVGFIDITLPNEKGQKVSLSEVAKDKKVVMVYFWASAMGNQKIFNLDVLKPIYNQFAPKGLEIYSISLDTDKAVWANALKHQAPEWINVCDGLGAASPVIGTYNVQSIPSLFFIINGEVVANTGVKNEATLRSFLASKL